jgi:hypothetical protein
MCAYVARQPLRAAGADLPTERRHLLMWLAFLALIYLVTVAGTAAFLFERWKH